MANRHARRAGLRLAGNRISGPFLKRDMVGRLSFKRGVLWSGSKGLITIGQCVTVVRPDTGLSTAPMLNGRVRAFGANDPRLTDEGLPCHGARQNTAKQNLNMADTSAWTVSNLLATNDGPWPFASATHLHKIVLPPGTTSFRVPKNWDNAANTIRCHGAGGHGAAGVAGATRTSGASGASGGYAEKSNVILRPGAVITVGVPAGGSGAVCELRDHFGVVQVLANSGTSAVGTTAGVAGSNTGAVGTLRRAGVSGIAGATSAGNRGGGAGPGAPGPDSAAGAGSSGNANGGGGASAANRTGSGNTTATSTDGGRGGDNPSGVGHGIGGTASTAAVDGFSGGGGGGGKSGTGINGSNGGNQQFSQTDQITGAVETFDLCGGGGGGGGFGGNGGNGGIGAGGGGGGATDTLSGLGGQGGPGTIVITYGGAASTRLTGTGSSPTIKQTIAVGGVNAIRSLSALIYIPHGATLAGQILLSQDDFANSVDVSSQITPGRWNFVVGPTQTASTDRVVGIRYTDPADEIHCSLMTLETGNTVSNFIPAQAAAATRNFDLISLNVENFPPWINRDQHTVYVGVTPRALPEPAPEDQSGWNVFSVSSDFEQTFEGAGYINGDDMLNITAVTSGTVQVGKRINVGTGVVFFTDIAEQISGTPGGIGVYRVTVDGVSGVAQTTAGAPGSSVVIKLRTKNLIQYLLNCAPKPAEAFRKRIGLTVRDEVQDDTTAWDPQKAFADDNVKHTLGYSITAGRRYGITFLDGDFDESDQGTGHFVFTPDVSKFTKVVLGTVGPDGVGAAVEGPMNDIFIGRSLYTPALGVRQTYMQLRAA